MKYLLKLVLIALLIGCWLKVPYGYFQFVRIGGTIMFIWLAIIANKERQMPLILFYGLMAALLQPVFKIHFNRQIWNIIDAAIAAVLLGILVIELLSKQRKNQIHTAGKV